MIFFTKNEAIGVGIILAVIFIISAFNMRISLRRARDAQRKDDLSTLVNTLEAYKIQYGLFPAASGDGKIVACVGPDTREVVVGGQKEIVNLASCDWGKNGFYSLKTMPIDPQSKAGVSYYYLSNGHRYQVYASLEGKDEDEFSPAVEKRNLPCGSRICNMGKTTGDTPLDKSIEEYENELRQKEQILKK
jgi:hypothetical protein